jgi:hypothetical protein
MEGISAKALAKYFQYLDQLRKSGVTNMYGAVPYLTTAFGLKREPADKVLGAWMETFSDETPKQRAAKAIAA